MKETTPLLVEVTAPSTPRESTPQPEDRRLRLLQRQAQRRIPNLLDTPSHRKITPQRLAKQPSLLSLSRGSPKLRPQRNQLSPCQQLPSGHQGHRRSVKPSQFLLVPVEIPRATDYHHLPQVTMQKTRVQALRMCWSKQRNSRVTLLPWWQTWVVKMTLTSLA